MLVPLSWLKEYVDLTLPVEKLADRLRSEERRVGKECRSRCDWSSDVCSSDLERLKKKEEKNDVSTPFVAERVRRSYLAGRKTRGSPDHGWPGGRGYPAHGRLVGPGDHCGWPGCLGQAASKRRPPDPG